MKVKVHYNDKSNISIQELFERLLLDYYKKEA